MTPKRFSPIASKGSAEMAGNLRILGVDPGLQSTGWGVVEENGQSLRHIAHGVLATFPGEGDAQRLAVIHGGIAKVIRDYKPHQAAVEETFANVNAKSTMRLREARGAALAALGSARLRVTDFAPNTVKKTVCGRGHADKKQVSALVGMLLGMDEIKSADAADALAVAICHIHHG